MQNMRDLNKQLEQEISRELERISVMAPGSEEHTAAIKSLQVLCEAKVKEDKLGFDCENTIQQRAVENEVRDIELEQNEKKLKWDKIRTVGGGVLTALGIGVKLADIVVARRNHTELLKWNSDTRDIVMYFEQEGKVVSDVGRQLLQKTFMKYKN